MGKKTKNVLITVCVILVVALIIGLNVFNSMKNNGTLLRYKVAAESENFEISGTMMAYFYSNNYAQLSSVLSQLGVDTSVSLKSQYCPYVTEGTTWFDYFVAMTKENTNTLLAICEAAHDAGLTLDDVDQTEIDASMESLEATAAAYGYTVNQYLALSIGSGVNAKDVRKCLELNAYATMYANQYTEGLTYTAEEMEAYYQENTPSFDGVDYLSFTVSAEDYMETDAQGEAVGDTTAASASAKEAADKIAAATSEDEFKKLVREYLVNVEEHDVETVDEHVEECFNRHVLAEQITSVSEWAFAASAGETYVDGEEGATSFTVYYLAKAAYRDESVNRNVRHILFSNETYEDSTKADEILAEWAAADYSDEKFAELVATYSEDEGSLETDGVYEDVANGETANAFNAWLFDANRQVGDKGIVESDYGWHIMEYLGEGEGTSWERSAKSLMVERDYEAMIALNQSGITYHADVIGEIDA